MTIKEIEERSGMTRANIRFYESEELLNPARNPNGYRDYSEEDLALLEKIRLLRTLQLSLADIRALQNEEETLSEALDRHLLELDRKDQELDRTQEICRTVRDDKASFDSLNVRHYLYAYEHAGLIEEESDSDKKSEDALFDVTIQTDTLPPVRAPWRRYFARTLDLYLYDLGWFAFLELIFNTNVANLSFSTILLSILSMGTMLLVESLFLKLFATTPGKWIMGFHITDRNEQHLTYGDGFSRTWTVLWRGMGLDFDYDSDVYLDENGTWVEYNSNVYSQGVTFYAWSSSLSPDVLDFDIVEEDGIVREISFQYETEDKTIYLSTYTEQMYLTALSFACAQKGFGRFSSARADLLNEISSHPIKGFSFSQNGITVSAQIECSGYSTSYFGSAGILIPKEDADTHYSLSFCITKTK